MRVPRASINSPALDKRSAVCQNDRGDNRLWRSGMALDAHLTELSDRHRALDQKIEQEQGRPTSDEFKIAEWKRQKLRLKDEMERLKHEPRH
jgi:hypothetical protein